jgi:hypothetical protein
MTINLSVRQHNGIPNLAFKFIFILFLTVLYLNLIKQTCVTDPYVCPVTHTFKISISTVDLKMEGKTQSNAKITVNVLNEGKCDKMRLSNV